MLLHYTHGASGTECGFCKTFGRCTRHGGMWACRPTPAAIGEVLCIRVASGRAMRAPTTKRTIVPRRESGPAPTRKPQSGSVGADCISARTAPPRRMHPRPLPCTRSRTCRQHVFQLPFRRCDDSIQKS